MKLSKNPKGEQLNAQNMIFKNEKFKFTEWLFGIVLYTGKDIKDNLN